MKTTMKTLTFLLASTALAYGMEQDEVMDKKNPITSHRSLDHKSDVAGEDVFKTIEKILKETEEIEKKIGKEFNTEGITVLLGDTGSGKTAVLNYNAGNKQNKLTARRNEYGIMRIRDEMGTIGQKYTAATRIPNLMNNWLDCPGLFDTRGGIHEILNSYSFSKLIPEAPKVRFLVTIPEAQLLPEAGRGRSVRQIIKVINAMFKEEEQIELQERQIERLKNALNIVVTGTTWCDNSTKFKAIIKEVASETEDDPSARNLLEFIASPSYEQIFFFEQPREEGDIPIKRRYPLISENAAYVEGLMPKVAFSAEAAESLRQLSNSVTQEISDCLQNFNNKHMVMGRLWRLDMSTAEGLRNLIEATKRKVESATFATQTLNQDKESITNLFKEFGANSVLINEFVNLIDKRRLLLKISEGNSQLDLKFDKTKSLNSIIKKLQDLSKAPKTKEEGALYSIKGGIVGTRDIDTKKRKTTDPLKGIKLLGDSILIVDNDLALPGVSVLLDAPYFTMRKNYTLSLEGKAAPTLTMKEKKASNGNNPSEKGEDGAPGKPGQSGGSLYITTDHVHTNGKLMIKLSGGNGGSGQNGGDGKKGKKGQDGKITNIKKREAKKRRVPEGVFGKARSFFTSTTHWRTHYIDEGQPGGRGGNAGAGGAEGLGGKKGTFTFTGDEGLAKKSKENIIEIAMDGKNGESGTDGKPGRGGKYGKDAKGIFVKTSPQRRACAKKSLGCGGGAATGGAIAGFCVAGPVGAVVGGGIGILAGAAAPVLATITDATIGRGWEEKPKLTPTKKSGKDGMTPESKNSNDRAEPSPSPIITNADRRPFRGTNLGDQGTIKRVDQVIRKLNLNEEEETADAIQFAIQDTAGELKIPLQQPTNE